MVRGRVKIVNIELNLNLDEEIRKSSMVDDRMKSRIDSIVERAKLREQKIDKKAREANLLEEQFGPLFSALLPVDDVAPRVTKSKVLEILNINKDQLGAVLPRLKKYLRVVKEGEWVLLIGKNDQKERVYYLQRFKDPD